MPPSTSAARDDEPLRIELELVRAEAADDAFAFRFARQTYLVRGAGGAYETAELPWSRELLRDLEEIRRPDRDPAVVARVGDMLRELLGGAGWPRHEATIVEARAARRRVHVTIRSAAAELYALPWELLTLRADGQHLGALDHVLLRYAWPGTSTVAAEEGEAPARLLVAWSAAGGGVPAAEQVKAIQEAAKAAGREDAVEVLPRASYGSIAEALEGAAGSGRPFRALHLLCHGAEAGSTFGLALEAEGGEGRPTVVDAGRLQQLLAPHAHSLRLVVVSACDGGNMGEPGNRIGSVAQRLHRAGVQYVIASRYPLSSRGSTRIAGALHQVLLGGEPVERAFVAARTAASREVSQLDWASLQLYARPEDGDRGCVLARAEVAGSEVVAASTAAGAAAAGPATTSASAEPIENEAAAAREGKRAAASVPVTASEPPAGSRGLGRFLPLAVGLVALVGVGLYLALGGLGEPNSEPAPKTAAADTTKSIERPAEPEPEPTPPPGASDDAGADTRTAGTSGAGDSGSTGDAGSTSSPSDAQPDAQPDTTKPDTTRPRSGSTKTKPTKPTPSTSQATVPCSSGLKRQIDDLLKSPGGGVYRTKVWAAANGSLVLQGCEGCGAERTSLANERLAGKKIHVDAEQDALPCRTTIQWE